MGAVLRAAGVLNLLLAVWVLGWPEAWFQISGMPVPAHLCLWQGAGILVGVLGIGYVVASGNPMKHWLMVCIGFLAKIAGLTGFVVAAFQGNLAWSGGWLLVLSSLIWLPPFAKILWAAACRAVGRPVYGEPMSLDEAMVTYRLSGGETLGDASKERVLAIVFLRHFGCTFTRQLLRNLEAMEAQVKEHNAKLVLVHMLQEGEEVDYLAGNESLARIADPRCELYRAFGLGKGGFLELFGPSVMYRGFIAFFRGCGVGHIAGDGLQMPGAFLVKGAKITVSRKARTAADLPDVEALFESESTED